MSEEEIMFMNFEKANYLYLNYNSELEMRWELGYPITFEMKVKLKELRTNKMNAYAKYIEAKRCKKLVR